MATEDNVDRPVHEGDDQQKADEACNEFFGFRPALGLQNVYKRCRKHGCGREIKRARNHAAIFACKAWRSRTVKFCFRTAEALLVGGAIAFGLVLLNTGAIHDSNAVIAAFTVVMAYTTIRAWIAMHAQNSIMIEQGKAIEQQAKLAGEQLEQAKVGSAQTDQIIEQMRLEQRAWLGPTAPKIEPITSGGRVKGTIPLKNSGPTPAYMEHGMCHVVVISPQAFDQHFVNAKIAEAWATEQRSAAIAPDTTQNFHFNTGPLRPIDYIAIEQGTATLFILGCAQYRDYAGVIRETICCYEYDAIAKSLFAYRKYNEMT